MKQALKKHVEYYFSLLCIFAIGVFLTIHFASDKQLQMLVLTLTAFLYAAWGIIHHLKDHDLTVKVVIEYVLVGSLGITILAFLLKGGFL